ncbi:hypothetical protein Emed_003887 [Eimeria media]
MGDWLVRLQRQPLRLLLPLMMICCCLQQQQQPGVCAAAGEGEAGASSMPRGPAPHTMQEHGGPLPLLREKTLFVINNEPILESHIVSNLLHQLFYTVGIPQERVKLRDEALLLGGPQARQEAGSLGLWLATVAESLPEDVDFVFLCSAYTRIDPPVLEALLTQLKKKSSSSSGGTAAAAAAATDVFVLGWGLVDSQSSILHHFAPAGSQVYPHLDAGTLWSRAAFLALKKAFKDAPPSPGIEKDQIFELSVHLKNAQKLEVLHSPLFCPLPPKIENYERAHAAYPAPHVRPQIPAKAEPPAAAAARKRELSAAETAAAAAAAEVAALHKGCAAFSAGTRHAPILSHQMFDALIDFDEELLVQREQLEMRYSPEDKTIEGGPFEKEKEELEKSRPAFIVEPQDLMIVVKTHAGNHASRIPQLRRLWASREALLQQAQQHSAQGLHDREATQEEQRQLKESYDALSLRFFSDKADPKSGIEAFEAKETSGGAIPEGKAGLCQRLVLILKEFLRSPETRRFLVVTDDDTLLNFRHMLDLLSLTLQPAIPARGFVANLLTDKHGYRAHHPKYPQLAAQIRKHLEALVAAGGGDAQQQKQEKKEGADKSSRYTAEQLTAASPAYGRSASRPRENVSPLYLGERYAYGLSGGGGNSGGYSYVTMGGGVALDREAVQLLVKCTDTGSCSCPPDGTADDMLLGLWAKQLDIPLLHARGMHQEKPEDYHPLLVEVVSPISFHRMQQSVKATKRMFAEYVDVGEHSSSSSSGSSSSDSSKKEPVSFDDLLEVDWIDYDWQHAEEHLWMEREELHEFDEDDPHLPKGIGDVLSRKVQRGTRPMTPEELMAHEELEEASRFHDEL